MQRLKALGILVRWPNLIFIALTQYLSAFCLVKPLLGPDAFNLLQQSYLVLCTVLIAAAGYMINDYFDWQIDTINKPDRVVVGKLIQHRSIILGHLGLNGIAMVLAFLALPQAVRLIVLLWPLGAALFLWFYSTTFKRKFLIGNIVVACMTTLTVAMPALFTSAFSGNLISQAGLKLLTYMGFAFLITLIREIVKDIEDIKGDASQACRTVPLVWGVNRARYLVDVLWAICVVALCLRAWMAAHISPGLWTATGILLIPIPFLVLKMHQAKTGQDFHRVSTWIKIYTLMGILSMLI